MRKIILSALAYDWLLEPFLHGIKEKVAGLLSRHNLYPALDICCGTGAQCRAAGRTGGQIFGLDLDFKMVRYASSRRVGAGFVCGDASHLPVRSARFKGIVISFALHEKTPGMQKAMLGETRRILKPGGRVVFVDFERPWNRRSRRGELLTRILEHLAGTRHYRNGRLFLDQGGLSGFLSRSGMVEVERIELEVIHSALVLARFGPS